MQSGASRPRAMGSREWYFIPRGCKTCNEVVELYSIKNKRKRKSTQTRSSMTHTTQPGCGSDGDGERVLLSGTVRGTWTRGAERARHRLLPARLLLALRAAAPPSIALTLDRRCLASVSLAPLASLATSSMSSMSASVGSPSAADAGSSGIDRSGDGGTVGGSLSGSLASTHPSLRAEGSSGHQQQ